MQERDIIYLFSLVIIRFCMHHTAFQMVSGRNSTSLFMRISPKTIHFFFLPQHLRYDQHSCYHGHVVFMQLPPCMLFPHAVAICLVDEYISFETRSWPMRWRNKYATCEQKWRRRQQLVCNGVKSFVAGQFKLWRKENNNALDHKDIFVTIWKLWWLTIQEVFHVYLNTFEITTTQSFLIIFCKNWISVMDIYFLEATWTSNFRVYSFQGFCEPVLLCNLA